VASVIDTVVNLAKRRGFVFPSGEIYAAPKSAWDYGPLGVELKENIKRQLVAVGGHRPPTTSVGIDSSIILPREVWVASGHVEVFHEPAGRVPELPPPASSGQHAGGLRREEGY